MVAGSSNPPEENSIRLRGILSHLCVTVFRIELAIRIRAR